MSTFYKICMLLSLYLQAMDMRVVINTEEFSKKDAIDALIDWTKECKTKSNTHNVDACCNWCKKIFANSRAVEQHKRTALIHEEDRLKAGYPELRYVCPLCDCFTDFNIHSNLVKHLKQIHAVTDYKNLIGTKSNPMTSRLITQYR